ncbi:hypothetical protein HanIR_Chr07g0300161 [Helianthus annuus]|nr:hypothetical protein HanIR_Chr07g0300161 [Helianthus annuus]
MSVNRIDLTEKVNDVNLKVWDVTLTRLENSLVASRPVKWGLATTRGYSGLIRINRIGFFICNFQFYV